MMTRVEGAYLLNENSKLEDVSAEVVADIEAAEGGWSVDLHFGLRGARAGFVGHRYAVKVPRDAAVFGARPTIESGYQLAGTLRVEVGRIVIDDPVRRARPVGGRVRYEPA